MIPEPFEILYLQFSSSCRGRRGTPSCCWSWSRWSWTHGRTWRQQSSTISWIWRCKNIWRRKEIFMTEAVSIKTVEYLFREMVEWFVSSDWMPHLAFLKSWSVFSSNLSSGTLLHLFFLSKSDSACEAEQSRVLATAAPITTGEWRKEGSVC